MGYADSEDEGNEEAQVMYKQLEEDLSRQMKRLREDVHTCQAEEEERLRNLEVERTLQAEEEERLRRWEEERIRQAEEERLQALEEERLRVAEEARIQLLEEERLRVAEEVRIQLLEDEHRLRIAEEMRIQSLEEERHRIMEEHLRALEEERVSYEAQRAQEVYDRIAMQERERIDEWREREVREDQERRYVEERRKQDEEEQEKSEHSDRMWNQFREDQKISEQRAMEYQQRRVEDQQEEDLEEYDHWSRPEEAVEQCRPWEYMQREPEDDDGIQREAERAVEVARREFEDLQVRVDPSQKMKEIQEHLKKIEDIEKTMKEVTNCLEEKSRSAVAWSRLQCKAVGMEEARNKLEKKHNELHVKEAKLEKKKDKWLSKERVTLAMDIDSIKGKMEKIQGEIQKHQMTDIEKLQYGLFSDNWWRIKSGKGLPQVPPAAQIEKVEKVLHEMKRIQSEVKGRLEEDMVAMEEITAGERLFDDNLNAAVWLSRPQTDSSTHQPCAPGNDIGARWNETNGMDNVRANAEVDDESQPEATGPPSKRQKVEATAVNLRRSTRVNSAKASADPSPPSCPVRPTPSGSGGGRAPLVNSPDAHQHELTKVKPTDVIAEEMPFAQAVNSRFLKKVCSNCLVMKSDDTESLKLSECVDCKKVCYCSKECRLVDAKFHQDECRYIRMSKYCPNEETRIVSRMITRVRNGDTPDSFNGRTFKDLMTHAEVISGEKAKLYKYKETFKSIRKFMGDNSPSEAEFLECFGKMLVNSFYTLSQSFDLNYITGTALYQGISIHNHSCRPNCVTVFDGNKITLKSLVPGTAYNTDLTFNYADILKPKEYRKHDLFDCECPRCKDPKEELLERSGKCDACPDGYILPSGEEPLHCERCGEESSLTIDSINRANEALRLCCEYDNVKELREDLGASAEAELRAKKEEVSSSLSKYNLFAYKANGLLQPKSVDESERSARETYEEWSYYYARRKETIEHYARDTAFHKAILVVIADHEKEIFEEVDNSREQAAKAADAYKAAYDASKSYYGPDHRLTKELKDKEDEMRKNV